MVRFIFKSILSVMILAAGTGVTPVSAAQGAVRPTVMNFQMAIPRSNPPFVAGDSLMAGRKPELVELELAIDTAGRVSYLRPTGVLQAERLKRLTEYFAGIEFLPARRVERPVPSHLAVMALLAPELTRSLVIYPVDTDASISDYPLFRRTLSANGVKPAGWKRFPWFHATIRPTDTTPVIRYALISLDLNKAGRLTNRKLISTNYPAFADQVTIATAWGTYTPARYRDTAVSSRNFLLISFFPSISYPTKPLVAGKLDTLSWHMMNLVRLLPDTVGFMSLPIPRVPTGSTFHLPPPKQLTNETAWMACTVDTLGVSSLAPLAIDTAGVTAYCRQLARQLRFYPAMDPSGRPRPFRGLISMTHKSEAIIRIRYLWLD